MTTLRRNLAGLVPLLFGAALPPSGAAAQDSTQTSASDSTRAGAGTLIGWVTDKSECTPVRGAEVSVGERLRATTDANGRFAISAVPTGSYTLRARRIGYAMATIDSVTIKAGALSDVGVQLDPRPVIATGPDIVPLSDSAAVADSVHPDEAAEGLRKRVASGRSPRVTWRPERPTQGTLFVVTLRGGRAGVDSTPVGTVAGEPLHFVRRDSATYEALAAIPINADSALLTLASPAADGAAHEETLTVVAARGTYRMEKLSVAPRFGTEPDSALAERLARESMLARRVSCRSHHTPRLWRGAFVRPRPGRVTSPFGGGREFNGVVQSRHMGTDLAGVVGAPIRAMNRGVVALVGDFYLGGRVVYVDHGAGLTSAYLHMSRRLVSKGDTVRAGQVIGRVGATGRVTGPHLHWIVRYGGVTVDPVSVFSVRPAK
jgi:murein DD-endopeptidase MepM/ murein hydrolase activator NlpD